MAKSTQSPETPNATRQMLDELDVLMERMLALPVDTLDESAPPESAQALAATLTLLAPPEVPGGLEVSAALPAPESEPESTPSMNGGSEWLPPSLATTAVTDSVTATRCQEEAPPLPSYIDPASIAEPQAPIPETPPGHAAVVYSQVAVAKPITNHVAASGLSPIAEVPPPLVLRRPMATAILPPLPMRGRSWRHLLYKPLLWINQGYDRLTYQLGETGRWLRGTPGRLALGLLGLVLLALAIAWGMHNWLGWN